MRADLRMSPGKLSAQAGHAYCDALDIAARTYPEIASLYRSGRHGVKVCLEAKNLRSLLRAYEEAQQAGLPCALVIDQHHIHPPYFSGEPIITALGIGPARLDQVQHITKRFSLFK